MEGHVPDDLFVLSFARFYEQALVVHLVYIAGGLHVAQDVILQLGNGL